MSPARLRRQPLALVWLWFNSTLQTAGLTTTWLETAADQAAGRAALHERIAALRGEHPRGGQ